MSELRSLQQRFQQYLLHPDADRVPQVMSSSRNDALARLSIYTSAYRSRLIEALETNYPKLSAWLDESGFARLALAYLAEHPSQYRSIRDFGDGLSEFLYRTAPWQGRQALAEMARFEWALAAAFDAADAVCATAEQMQALPAERWADAVFVAHPSVRCLDLDWNVVQIWKDLDRGERAPEAQAAERRTWLIWRCQLDTRFRSLMPAEAAALTGVLDGQTFAELCQGLCAHHPEVEVASRAAALLWAWLDSGLISEIHA